MTVEVTLDTVIEDLVEAAPDAVTFLMERGIRCLRCGEPVWGTLGEAMSEKDFDDETQQRLVSELRHYLSAS